MKPKLVGVKDNRSLLNGSLARLATGELVQVCMGAYDSRGHRVLKFQVTTRILNLIRCRQMALYSCCTA